MTTKLPACLTTFGIKGGGIDLLPPLSYDAIVSRRAGAMRINSISVLAWSYVPSHRCILTREQFLGLQSDHFLICVLQEFR